MDTTIEYELDRSDLEAFFAHTAEHTPYFVKRNRRMRWFWGAAFGVIALLYARSSPAFSVVLASFAVLFLAFYGRLNRWWFVRHNRRLNAGPDGPRLGHTKLELCPGELAVETPEGSARLALSAIRRIDESDSHYFIYMGPVSALVVPKSTDRGDPIGTFIRSVREAQGAAGQAGDGSGSA